MGGLMSTRTCLAHGLRSAVLLVAAACLVTAPIRADQDAPALSNSDIVRMIAAKLGDGHRRDDR
jgi:hypothetical protein